MLEPTPAENKGIFSGVRRERERRKFRKEAFACFEALVMPRPLAVPIISKQMALVCAEGIGFSFSDARRRITSDRQRTWSNQGGAAVVRKDECARSVGSMQDGTRRPTGNAPQASHCGGRAEF